jgi:hypothetical protein
VALGHVFSEYFGFPTNLHSTNFSTITITYHPGLVQWACNWPQYSKSHPTNLGKKLSQYYIKSLFFLFVCGSLMEIIR